MTVSRQQIDNVHVVQIERPEHRNAVDAATALRSQVALAIDTVGTAVRYELTGGAASRQRRPIALDNPVLWQDAPEPLGQTVATLPSTQSSKKVIALEQRWKFGGAVTPQAPSTEAASDAVARASATQSGMPIPRNPLPVRNRPGMAASRLSMSCTRCKCPTSYWALARSQR